MKKVKNLKINRITFFITGIIFIFFGLFFVPFLLIGVFLLFLSYQTNKAYRDILKNDSLTTKNDESECPYIFFPFKVAGVTFKNGRKTRQAILRSIKWGNEPLEAVNFENYVYDGKNAVYVKINDQIVGNIPSDYIETFLEYEKKYKRDNIFCEISGGGKLEDGSQRNYGCNITVRYLK